MRYTRKELNAPFAFNGKSLRHVLPQKNQMRLLIILSLCLLWVSCNKSKAEQPLQQVLIAETLAGERFKQDASTIADRINVPEGYERTTLNRNSFQQYLRHLKLKPSGTLVRYYNGAEKPNYNVYAAVVDLEIGKKDLHQCADAIMRLKAEYLWEAGQYDKIHFNFTNGDNIAYTHWMNGERLKVNGNKTSWVKTTSASNTYKDFWNYMELIFMYAGTASLEKEMQSIDIESANIGDVLIQGGFPGHAVIIVDKAVHKTTQKPIFLLAQSYMPAQEIHILKNFNDETISPWYAVESFDEVIATPEWQFSTENVKQF